MKYENEYNFTDAGSGSKLIYSPEQDADLWTLVMDDNGDHIAFRYMQRWQLEMLSEQIEHELKRPE